MFGQQVPVGGNKQICSYYLKGTCKYGTKCWYYHPPNQGGGSGVFGGASNVFGGKSGTQQDSKEFTDFVKQVSGEMTQWERSGQWLPSSFTPLKAHPLLVGFTDTSPEEFRVEAYTAHKNNTYASYQANWADVQQRFKQLREALKMSTPEAVQALRDVFYTKSPLEQQQQQVLKQPTGLFGKTSSSVIGSASGSSSSGTSGLLGAAPQGSLFGSPAPSIFGGSAQPSTTPGIFGGAGASKTPFGTQTSVFGASGGSVFGAAASATPSVFGAAPTQPQASAAGPLFGTPAAQGAAQTPGSVFGAPGGSTQQATPATATQSSIFGQQQQQPQQQGGLFGAQQQQQQTQQGGLFGTQQQQQQQPPQQTGLFGAQPQQQTGLFGSQQQQQQQQPQPQPQQQQTGGLFGAQPQRSSAFAFAGSQPGTQPQAATPSIFGGTPFGGAAAQQGGKGLFGMSGGGLATGMKPDVFSSGGWDVNPKPGLFGKPAEPTPGLFGQGGQPPPAQATSPQAGHNYTPLDQLRPEDRAQFEAESFTYVPLCPPPIELCT